jgi:hypothetical protein
LSWNSSKLLLRVSKYCLRKKDPKVSNVEFRSNSVKTFTPLAHWRDTDYFVGYSTSESETSYICTRQEFGVYLGSMLWSQFSAIFANFRGKIGVFSKNNVMITFVQKLAAVWAKTPIFSAKKHNIITSVPSIVCMYLSQRKKAFLGQFLYFTIINHTHIELVYTTAWLRVPYWSYTLAGFEPRSSVSEEEAMTTAPRCQGWIVVLDDVLSNCKNT